MAWPHRLDVPGDVHGRVFSVRHTQSQLLLFLP